MTVNLGKRRAGALTAASPGDTLYIPFASYNDSGDSEALSGLAVSDIEVFKDGGVTSRATDSGYSIISDTGQYGDRVGLYRCSIQLFNTTDDASFYAAGSQYHVAIDAVTVDGKNVRFFPAIFEIEANTDTGAIADAVWSKSARVATSVSGSVGSVTGAVGSVTGAVGSVSGNVSGSVGSVATDGITAASIAANAIGASELATDAVNEIAQATAALDTGLRQLILRTDTGAQSAVTKKLDTGVPASVRVAMDTGTINAGLTGAVASVTGAVGSVSGSVGSVSGNVDGSVASVVGNVGGNVVGSVASVTTVSSGAIDTGSYTGVASEIAHSDTGVKQAISRLSTKTDTGVPLSVWASAARTLTAWAFDTGVQQKLDRLDTGVHSDLHRIIAKIDTGVAATIGANAIDTGTFTGKAAFAQDTGVLLGKIWGYASRVATSVSGNVDGSVNNLVVANDTGVLGEIATLNTAVSNLSTKVDTGVPASVWEYSVSTKAGDTGSTAYAQGRLMAVKGDTGAAHVDAGRLGVSAPAAALDTGATKDAVWGTAPGTSTRYLTGSANIDTGVADTVWKYSTSGATGDTGSVGYAQGRLMAVKGDTGAAHVDAGRLGVSAPAAALDTGATKDAVWGTAPGTSTRVLTALDVDTGLRQLINRMDTGISGTVDRIDAVDTGTRQLLTRLSQKVDTGVPLSVWASTTRSLTAFVHDTGVADTVWKASLSTYTDTGSAGYKLDLVDTGIRSAIAAVDTGTTINLNRILAKIDTGVGVTVDFTPVTNKLDTGVPPSVWAQSGSSFTDTGSLGYKLDLADTGVKGHIDSLSTKVDTGVPLSVWAAAARTLTAWAFDTGVQQKLDRLDTGVHSDLHRIIAKVDTGVTATVDLTPVTAKLDSGVPASVRVAMDSGTINAGLAGAVASVTGAVGSVTAAVSVASIGANVVNDFAFAADAATKIAARVKVMYDSGTWQDTGLEESVARLSAKLDTGVPASVWAESGSAFTDTGSLGYKLDLIDTGIRSAIAAVDTGTTINLNRILAKLDTGVPASVKALADTGIHPVNIEQIDSFANAAVDLRQFVLKLSDSGTMDTGTFPFIKKLDTGNAADHALTRTSLAAVDTGIQGELDRIKAKIDTGVTASVNIDTGQINQAVWQGDATRTLTAMDYDTGIRQALARHDTGVHSDLHRLIAKVDTGVSFTPDLTPVLNKLDTGVVNSIVDPLRVTMDTGVPSAVWAWTGGRELTAFTFPVDTGPLQAIARLDTGINETIDRIFTQTDTGGVAANLTPVTAKLDTGVVSANIVQVNSTAVQGTGDTGTNDPWRPA